MLHIDLFPCRSSRGEITSKCRVTLGCFCVTHLLKSVHNEIEFDSFTNITKQKTSVVVSDLSFYWQLISIAVWQISAIVILHCDDTQYYIVITVVLQLCTVYTLWQYFAVLLQYYTVLTHLYYIITTVLHSITQWVSVCLCLHRMEQRKPGTSCELTTGKKKTFLFPFYLWLYISPPYAHTSCFHVVWTGQNPPWTFRWTSRCQ